MQVYNILFALLILVTELKQFPVIKTLNKRVDTYFHLLSVPRGKAGMHQHCRPRGRKHALLSCKRALLIFSSKKNLISNTDMLFCHTHVHSFACTP